jgi:peptidoglycan hydrolase CwlO-like protein
LRKHGEGLAKMTNDDQEIKELKAEIENLKNVIKALKAEIADKDKLAQT